MPEISLVLPDALDRRYRMIRELGARGMAMVYLMHDARHGRDVAVKVLRSDYGEAVGRERFLQEIQLASRLQHPNILGLLDSGEVGGMLFYIMPFIPGGSLRERRDRDGPLPL